MFCRYCGKEIPNNSNYCLSCGKKQQDDSPKYKNQITQLFYKHKRLLYMYFVWLFVHLSLLFFSSPTKYEYSGRYGNQFYDLSDGFYPFDISIGNVLRGRRYFLDFIGNVDVYDVSELFVYVVLIPFLLFGLLKCYPLLVPFIQKIKDCYRHWKYNKEQKTINEQLETQVIYTQTSKNQELNSIDISSTTYFNYNNLADKYQVENNDTGNQIVSLTATDKESEQDKFVEEEIVPSIEPQTMPLFRRFVGSMIDKVLLLIVFVIGSIIISPYGAAGQLGSYYGLRNTPLNLYEYIDRSQMNNYGTYYEGISKNFQDLARLESEPPHIGSTLELDMNITFSFILLNLIYYVVFESVLSASLGKRMLKGVLVDHTEEKIGLKKALIRGACLGAFMIGTYLLLHLQMGLNNKIVVIVFFCLLDFPIILTKRSLLDLCTDTTYAKQQL